MSLIVPGLPTEWSSRDGSRIDLSAVPDEPISDVDPDRADKVAAWCSWAREVMRYRRERRILCAKRPKLRELEVELCRRSPTVYFPATWCHVYEPRPRQFFELWDLISPHIPPDPGSVGWLPAIPFPFHVRLQNWIVETMAKTGAAGTGVCPKPRDMGVTWTFANAFAGLFLFTEPFSAKIISRREDEVDKPGDLGSIFERLTCHLNIGPKAWASATLPDFLRPDGWHDLDHDHDLFVRHPLNGNNFSGESTSSRSGRGSRSSVGLVDEAAHIRELRELMAALRQTVGNLFLVSSEYVGTTSFWAEYTDEIQRIRPESVFRLQYWMHPFHDETYLLEQREAMQDDEAFSREVLGDRWAGFSGWLYEEARDIEPLAEERTWEEPAPLVVGIDPGQDDETAIAVVMLDSVRGRDTVLEAYASKGKTPEWWACLILGLDPDSEIVQNGIQTTIGDAYGIHFTERERDISEFFASHPQPVVFGDPYGDTAHIRKHETYYAAMRIFALKHNKRLDSLTPRALTIICGHRNDQRHFQGRRLAVKRWLPTLDWNPGLDVKKTLHAIKNSKFDDPDRARQAEQRDAKHDNLSHRRTSIEFIAVNREYAYRMDRPRRDPYFGHEGDRLTIERAAA